MSKRSITSTVLTIVLAGAFATTTTAQDGPDTVDPCTTDAVRVTGDIIWGGLERDPLSFEIGDSEHIRDFVFESRIKADDARIEGDTVATLEWDLYRLDRKPRNRAGVNRGTFRIENPDGSWEGPWSGIGIATDSWRGVIQLDGQDAYEGLSATLFVHSGESGPISGVVYPTGLATCDFGSQA